MAAHPLIWKLLCDRRRLDLTNILPISGTCFSGQKFEGRVCQSLDMIGWLWYVFHGYFSCIIARHVTSGTLVAVLRTWPWGTSVLNAEGIRITCKAFLPGLNSNRQISYRDAGRCINPWNGSKYTYCFLPACLQQRIFFMWQLVQPSWVRDTHLWGINIDDLWSQ